MHESAFSTENVVNVYFVVCIYIYVNIPVPTQFSVFLCPYQLVLSYVFQEL